MTPQTERRKKKTKTRGFKLLSANSPDLIEFKNRIDDKKKQTNKNHQSIYTSNRRSKRSEQKDQMSMTMHSRRRV